jgi:hypothetical protein
MPEPVAPPDASRSILPDYAGRGLANVAASAVRLLGGDDNGLLPGLAADVLPPALLDGVECVVILLADGLGYQQLLSAATAGDAPALARLLDAAARGEAHLARLTSVFPSATMAALASLQTALPPAEHGIMGWTMYLHEFGQVAETARWGPAEGRGSYQDADLGTHDPVRFFGTRTIYRRVAGCGVRSFIVNPAEYKGTALSRMLFDGAETVGYRQSSGLAVNLERVIESRSAGERRLVYGYYAGVDAATHVFGPPSQEHAAEVATFDFFLGRWLARVRRDGRTLVLLTADHGHVHTPAERTLFVDQYPAVTEHLLALPAGERRILYLHAKPGQRQALRTAVEQAWGHAGRVCWADDLLEQGLFGPREQSDAARRRIGDVILLADGDWQYTYGPRDGRRPRLYAGNHGALDPAEMQIPLLAWRL